MSTTITIRTEDRLRSSLEKRARERGVSLSALVREILEAAVDERPLGRRAGHLRGALQRVAEGGPEPDGWRRDIVDRNVRS